MIIASDNTATNFCIDRAGIEETNQLIRQLGLEATRLRRKMMDHTAAVREQENISTPGELVQMLTLLYQKKPSPWVAEQALAILKKPKSGFLNRALPAGIEIANKPGWVEAARCDAGLIFLPRRPYVIAVMTKYTMCGNVEHEHFIAHMAATVHAAMTVLDKSNRYGRTLYN
jgi:beta-lactamase class A